MPTKLIHALVIAQDFYRGVYNALITESLLLDLGFHSVRFTKHEISARYLGVEYKLERI